MTKQELRTYIKQLLKTTDNLSAKSEALCKKILCSNEYKNSKVVLAYMALPDEPDLLPLIKQAVAEGKAVFIPRIIPNTNNMDFYLYNEEEINTGSYSINEPSTKLPMYNPEILTANTLVLVPGRAFSPEGNRLGRGKGFYDNYLFKIKKAAAKTTAFSLTLAGVCFSCQVLDSIPVEDHDIRMNLIFEE